MPDDYDDMADWLDQDDNCTACNQHWMDCEC